MEGSHLPGTRIQTLSEGEGERIPRGRREEEEHWASALAGVLLGTVHSPRPVEHFHHSPPEAWQGAVGDMTPGTPPAGQPTTTSREKTANSTLGPASTTVEGQGSGSEESRSIQVRVTTEELGEVAILVERQVHGLRVTISSEQVATLESLAADQAWLRNTLLSMGHQSATVRFIRMDQVGTVLAQPKANTNPSSGDPAPEDGEPARAGVPRRKGRRLDLIG